MRRPGVGDCLGLLDNCVFSKRNPGNSKLGSLCGRGRARANVLEGAFEPAHSGFSAEHAPRDFDSLFGPVGEIGRGASAFAYVAGCQALHG